MKTSLQIVTPDRARTWLKSNSDNRRIRPFAVEELRAAWERGEWKVTHQGIAFAKSGRLLDGQHRLTFISQLPEGTGVAINVSTECDEDVFGAIDQHVRRTLSDVTGVSADLAALGRFLAKVQNSSATTGLTPQFVAPFIAWALPAFSELVTFSPNKAPVWSSAAVRAAAVFQINAGHDIDFVKLSYDSLVRSDIDAMPFGARALAQQRMSGKIVSARSLDLFCRALRAFDSTKRMKIKSILVLDQTKTLGEVRAVLDHLAKKGQAEAGPTVAKPGANSKPARMSVVA